MPEKDRDENLLEGETEVTTSSDEYVRGLHQAVHNEVYGLNENLIDIAVYKAHQEAPTQKLAAEKESQSTIVSQPSAKVYNLEGLPLPKFALQLRRKRLSELSKSSKKAA